MDIEVAEPRPRFAWMRRFSVPREHFVAGNRLLLREQNFPLSLVVVNNLAQTSNEQNQRTHNKE